MYYCFGCGAGGNVFTFLMEYENFTFVEALKFLADRAGVELPQMEYSKEAKEQADLKNTLLEINKLAAKFYYYQLHTERGKQGYDYLKGRGLSDDTIRKFGLGYSDKYGSLLYRFLKEKGYDDEILRQSGLFLADEVHGMQDKFWNRVIYPIMDANSRVIGFGGRVMGDGKPKYLNSPETKIFDKSRNLYGLHLARSSRRKNLIICEGYMDVISMHQAGFNNAVASLGTALTSLQAGLMKRYTDEVLVIYDSDEAGVKAALRAIPMLKGVGLTTRVVNLRPYKDPDEFIQHEGCEAFEKRLEEAENSVLYEIRMKERDFDLADPQGKSDFLHEAVRRLVAIEDEIERNSYLEAVAGKYGIAVEVLRKQVGQMALSGAGRTERVKPRNTAANKKEKEGGVEKAQKLMLTWMTSYPALIGKLEKYITPEDFTTPLYRQIAEMIVLQYHEGGVNPAKLLNQFVDSEEQKEVAGLFNARIPLETEEEKRRALHDVICNMKENSIAYQSAHMNVTDMAALQKLMADKKSLERWKAGELPDFAF